MTLNGVIAVILRYFSEFGYLSGVLRKSSRSLSHLLMSSGLTFGVVVEVVDNLRSRCALFWVNCCRPSNAPVRLSSVTLVHPTQVAKSVTLNDLERRNGPYFVLFYRIRRRKTIMRLTYSVSKSTSDSCDHINMICAIIEWLLGQNKLWWFCLMGAGA